jgi:hypothetical protein
MNPYSSRLLIHAAGRTPVQPREPRAVRHPPHTRGTAEPCAQTCMPHGPDPDVPAMRVSSAANASIPPAHTLIRIGPHKGRVEWGHKTYRRFFQRKRPQTLLRSALWRPRGGNWARCPGGPAAAGRPPPPRCSTSLTLVRNNISPFTLGKWAVSGGHTRPADRDQDPRHRRLCLLVRTHPSGGGGARQERRHILA